MGKRVTHLEMHDGFFIPGLLADAGGGAFGKSIPSSKSLTDLFMVLNDNGSVEVSWGKPKERATITIGAANVKYVRHAQAVPVEPVQSGHAVKSGFGGQGIGGVADAPNVMTGSPDTK